MQRPLTAALLVLTLAVPASAQNGPRHPKYPRWFADLDAARAEARKLKQPMFLVFRCEP